MKTKYLTYEGAQRIVRSKDWQGESGNGKDYEIYAEEILQRYWELQNRRLEERYQQEIDEREAA